MWALLAHIAAPSCPVPPIECLRTFERGVGVLTWQGNKALYANMYCKGSAMPRNIRVTIGDHFESFIAEQLKDGRFCRASEVVCAGLRLLEEREIRVRRLRAALVEGEESGFVEYDQQAFMDSLN